MSDRARPSAIFCAKVIEAAKLYSSTQLFPCLNYSIATRLLKAKAAPFLINKSILKI